MGKNQIKPSSFLLITLLSVALAILIASIYSLIFKEILRFIYTLEPALKIRGPRCTIVLWESCSDLNETGIFLIKHYLISVYLWFFVASGVYLVVLKIYREFSDITTFESGNSREHHLFRCLSLIGVQAGGFWLIYSGYIKTLTNAVKSSEFNFLKSILLGLIKTIELALGTKIRHISDPDIFGILIIVMSIPMIFIFRELYLAATSQKEGFERFIVKRLENSKRDSNKRVFISSFKISTFAFLSAPVYYSWRAISAILERAISIYTTYGTDSIEYFGVPILVIAIALQLKKI